MAKKKADLFCTPFSNVFLLNGSKKNKPFFQHLIPHRVEGCRGECRGGYFSPPVFLHLHRLLFFISAICVCSPTAVVCSPPAFEDGAGGVSRENARGRCLRRAMGVLGESVGILCSGRMLGTWRK